MTSGRLPVREDGAWRWTSACRWCGLDVAKVAEVDRRWCMIVGLCAYVDRGGVVGGCRAAAETEAAIKGATAVRW